MFCKNCWQTIKSQDDKVECSKCKSTIHKRCATNKGGIILCDVCALRENKPQRQNKPDFKIPEVIRRSYIELYKTCPYKFFKQVIEGNEQPKNIYAELGIATHNLFEKGSLDKSYGKSQMIRDFNEIFELFDDDIYSEYTNKEDMYKRGIDSIETFYDVNSRLEPPYKTEETIIFDVGEDLPKVQATSDRVNLVDGELEVCDWKTGKPLIGKELETDLQAPLYVYSIKDKHKMPVRSFTFYYLKDNKERQFLRESEDIYVCTVGKREYRISLKESIEEVRDIFNNIKLGRFKIPRRNMHYPCKMCHLRVENKCQGAEVQGWKQYNK